MQGAHRPADEWRLRRPDDVLLRRFGHVRAVGGIAWFVVVVVLALRYGWAVWPVALGVPVLAIVTTLYFARSTRYPRTMVTVSLIADAVVLAGAIAFFGGTGSGLVLLYAIVVVSAGLLLGPSSALGFTVLCVLLGFGQLGLEQAGVTPQELHRPELGDRLAVLLASSAGLVSVGYLAGTYASRLHELITVAGAEAEQVRARGRRRHGYVRQAGADVSRRLAELEAIAGQLDGFDGGDAPGEDPAGAHRADAAARLRLGLSELEAAVGELADAAAIDAVPEAKPEPVRLPPVVGDCLRALAERLGEHRVTTDIPDVRVVGHRGALRRVVYNLLENAAEHTPAGTRVHVAARSAAGQCVLAVTDDGPGIAETDARRLFEPPSGRRQHVGLPLVRELCEAMGGQVRFEAGAGSGARFIVTLRMAPSAAPTAEDSVPLGPEGGA